jgi:hypothetical protein
VFILFLFSIAFEQSKILSGLLIFSNLFNPSFKFINEVLISDLNNDGSYFNKSVNGSLIDLSHFGSAIDGFTSILEKAFC